MGLISGKLTFVPDSVGTAKLGVIGHSKKKDVVHPKISP